MKLFLWIGALILISCNNNTNSKKTVEEKKDSIIVTDTTQPAAVLVYTRYVPVQVLAHLSKSLPNWKIPDPSSWEKHWWDQYKTDSTLVNYMSGDFNCDGSKDHAMVLTDEKNNIGAWAFIAKGGGYENFKLDEFANLYGIIECGLIPLTAGKHGDLNKEDLNYRVDVKCPGITVIFFESAARSYYFENGKLKWIQTGD